MEEGGEVYQRCRKTVNRRNKTDKREERDEDTKRQRARTE